MKNAAIAQSAARAVNTVAARDQNFQPPMFGFSLQGVRRE
jgi:hypothetical protein